MNLSGINSIFTWGSGAVAKPVGGKGGGAESLEAAGTGAVAEFLEYMKLTPEQKMLQAWLGGKGMTMEEFKALPKGEQDKLLAEMREDIKKKIEEGTLNAKPGALADVEA